MNGFYTACFAGMTGEGGRNDEEGGRNDGGKREWRRERLPAPRGLGPPANIRNRTFLLWFDTPKKGGLTSGEYCFTNIGIV